MTSFKLDHGGDFKSCTSFTFWTALPSSDFLGKKISTSIGAVDELDCCQFQKLNSARHILKSNLLHTVLSSRHGSIHAQLTITNTSSISKSLLISRPNHVGIDMEPSFPKVCPHSTQSHPPRRTAHVHLSLQCLSSFSDHRYNPT